MNFSRLSEKETDVKEKLSPSISYLQRLGPEHMEVIFKYSHWLFEEDENLAFEVS
jgi:Vam6/Vps39-like protein vacuolar protein sorting-associated protein 39